jgi:hypothetical protein
MTGIRGGAFLSSDWANHSRKPVEREKIKHFETTHRKLCPPTKWANLHSYIFLCVKKERHEQPMITEGIALSFHKKTLNHIQENKLTSYTI